MKILIGITLVVGTIAMFLWNSVPRLMSEVWHARDFVPAQSYAITSYKCTNWKLFIFNDCTATFVSLPRVPRSTIISRKRGRDSSSTATPWNLRKAVTARAKFTSMLAQRATNKKMLKQPSFRSAMTG